MNWQIVRCEIHGTDTVDSVLSNGRTDIEILAELERNRDQAIVRGLHVQGPGRNTVGVRVLQSLIHWAKEQLDVREPIIEGATRTSGAGSGRHPPPIGA